VALTVELPDTRSVLVRDVEVAVAVDARALGIEPRRGELVRAERVGIADEVRVPGPLRNRVSSSWISMFGNAADGFTVMWKKWNRVGYGTLVRPSNGPRSGTPRNTLSCPV